jgi:hypothetical protein
MANYGARPIMGHGQLWGMAKHSASAIAFHASPSDIDFRKCGSGGGTRTPDTRIMISGLILYCFIYNDLSIYFYGALRNALYY